MKAIHLTALLGLSACMAPKSEPAPVDNPMSALWAGITTDIDKLEDRHAPKTDWDKSAPENIRITSIAKLLEVLPQPLSKSETEEISDQFRAASLTVHYGFDCNFHALVFFDTEMKARKVIKW